MTTLSAVPGPTTMYGIAGLLTGRTLAARYRIDAVIGRGGMGAVYRATDERLGREVAVKVIGAAADDPGEHARLRARFQREARAAAAIRHPNVVQVHDFGTDPETGLDYLVMELLRGEDLAMRLTRLGPPPPHVAAALLRQAARGLAAGHRLGLVHRDVKPGNLFLEEDDSTGELRVRVLDFGIAAVHAEEGTLTQLTQVGRAPFSPAYASPEQLRGEDRVTPASDVFSLAAVGYHLATGVRPFTSSDPTRAALELTDSLMHLRPRAPGLPERVQAALLRALSRNPADRFVEAGAFAEALGSAGGAPEVVGPVGARAAAPLPEPTLLAPETDRTQWLQPSPPPRAMTGTPVGRSADPAPAARLAWPGPPVAAAPAVRELPGQVNATLPAPLRPGPLRRLLGALWNAAVTLFALALFALAWAMAADGVVKEEREQIYLAAAATVLLTPIAVHRLAGRQGRLRVALLGSMAATWMAVRAVGLDGDPAIALAAVFGLQVLACFGAEWLTGRRPRPPGS